MARAPPARTHWTRQLVLVAIQGRHSMRHSNNQAFECITIHSAIATTSSTVLGEDGGYLNQRIQESLLAGNPAVSGADARCAKAAWAELL